MARPVSLLHYFPAYSRCQQCCTRVYLFLELRRERLARLLMPLLLILACAGATFAMSKGAPWDEVVTRAFAIIAISCPCALTLAVPLALVAATTTAAQNGIVLQDISAIERGA